jgi:hypothetical protein
MSQPVAEVGAYKNITATGVVTTGPCQLLGFYVNSTSSGPFPANVGTSLHATEGGTLDVTFFFASGN